jgi:hypothetical protein
MANILSKSKARLDQLERDHKWRLVKVVYIVLAVLIVVVIGYTTYESSKLVYNKGEIWSKALLDARRPMSNPIDRGGDKSNTFWAVFLSTTVLWGVYRFLLPKLYLYLKSPHESDKNHHKQM